MQEDELLKNEKTYDAVFWTALNTLERYIVPLINEVFGKNYPSDAQVRLVPLKHDAPAVHIAGYADQRLKLFRRHGTVIMEALHVFAAHVLQVADEGWRFHALDDDRSP